jgi:hypothetical protein
MPGRHGNSSGHGHPASLDSGAPVVLRGASNAPSLSTVCGCGRETPSSKNSRRVARSRAGGSREGGPAAGSRRGAVQRVGPGRRPCRSRPGLPTEVLAAPAEGHRRSGGAVRRRSRIRRRGDSVTACTFTSRAIGDPTVVGISTVPSRSTEPLAFSTLLKKDDRRRPVPAAGGHGHGPQLAEEDNVG